MTLAVSASTTQTPTAKNFNELKRYVASWVQGARSSGVLADAGIALNATIDMINMETWLFMLKTHDITPTADEDEFSIPQDFDKPRALMVLDSNGRPRRRLGYLDPKTFNDNFAYSPASTTPRAYTVHNPTNSLVLTVNCNVSQGFIDLYPTWRLWYLARLLHFAEGNDTMTNIGATPEVWTVLGWGARMEFAGMRGGDVRTCERMLYGVPAQRRVGLLDRLRIKDATQYTDIPTDRLEADIC